MNIKDIYFVRHGQTQANHKHTHQQYDEPLSELGVEQAKKVGKHLVTKNPDTLLTSPFPRARETAEYIQDTVDIPYMIVESVHEILRPTFLYGKSHYSFATALYLLQLFWFRSENGWDNDQAENMFDLRNRVHDTKDMLTEEAGERIVVVSHSIFIDMFIHLVCQEKPMSFWKFLHLLIYVKKIPNTAVVHVQFDADAVSNTCTWNIVSTTSPEDFAQ